MAKTKLSIVVTIHGNSKTKFKLNLIFDKEDGTFQKNICALRKHSRRYAHALRFAVGLHDIRKFLPIVKYKHHQIQVERETV